MRRMFMMLIVVSLTIDLSFHGVSAMDVAPPLSDDTKQLDKDFQSGIIELAKRYNLVGAYPTVQGTLEVPTNNIVERCSDTGYIISDPEQFRQNSHFYNRTLHSYPLPLGDYKKPAVCPVWIVSKTGDHSKRGQGLKIHISAKPETALKIAQIVVPILHENDIRYKVMYDLPYMRYMYYLTQYNSKEFLMSDGRSSQAGKFIAIYTRNPEEAVSVLHKLEEAFKEHGLSPKDFVQLAGDAEVGDTGGIFVRYGRTLFSNYKGRNPKNITAVDQFDMSISQETMRRETGKEYDLQVGLLDERIYPWPDYMNNRNIYNGPFLGNLQVTWVNPDNPAQVITWENRPNCWAELKGEQCARMEHARESLAR